jgi:hypothetical protein
MASGTIYGTTGNQYIDSKIEWSSVANSSNNSSTVKATLYYKRNNSGFQTLGTGTFSITINGQTTSNTTRVTVTNALWVPVVSAEVTVPHNADGTKTVAISAAGSIPNTTLTSTTCSGNITLEIIQRASTITAAHSVTLGTRCSIKWTPQSTVFYFKVKFSLSDWSFETEAFRPGVATAYTYTGYQIPIDVANQFPNSISGTMTATLTTFASDAKTQIGNPSSKTFTVTIPNVMEVRPDVSMTVAPVNGSLADKFSSLYIQGKSKVAVTLSGSGKYSAGIRYCEWSLITDRGVEYGSQSSLQSNYIMASGKGRITGYSTDTRGYMSAPAEEEIDIIPYTKPKLLPVTAESSIVCERCDENGNLDDSGTYLRVRAKRSYSKVESNGTQYNYCLMRYRYKAEGETEFHPWNQLLAKDATTDEADAIIPNTVTSNMSTYVVELGVIDDIGESTTLSFDIPTAQVAFHLKEGGNGAAFGKYATKENVLECEFDAEFNGDMTLQGNKITSVVIEEGSKGDWKYRKWSSGIAECWAMRELSVSITNQWETVYYGEIDAFDFPFDFKRLESCQVSASFGAYAMQAAWLCTAGTATYKQAPALWMIRPNAEASTSFKINYYAIGTWK